MCYRFVATASPRIQSFHDSLRSTIIRHPTYLETGLAGRTRAYVFRYPGFYVEGETRDAVLASLPEMLRTEMRWLAGHGVEDPYCDDEVETEVVEEIALDTDVARGEWRGLFRYELRPTTPADVERALERTALARGDLAQRLEGLDAKSEPVRERMQAHVAAERVLLTKLGTRERHELPDDDWERVVAVRRITEERLRNLLPGDKERLAVFDGEKWTTRKVLRCLAVEERRFGRELIALLESGTDPKSSEAHSPR